MGGFHVDVANILCVGKLQGVVYGWKSSYPSTVNRGVWSNLGLLGNLKGIDLAILL